VLSAVNRAGVKDLLSLTSKGDVRRFLKQDLKLRLGVNILFHKITIIGE
jgi:hypothetical protein